MKFDYFINFINKFEYHSYCKGFTLNFTHIHPLSKSYNNQKKTP